MLGGSALARHPATHPEEALGAGFWGQDTLPPALLGELLQLQGPQETASTHSPRAH